MHIATIIHHPSLFCGNHELFHVGVGLTDTQLLQGTRASEGSLSTLEDFEALLRTSQICPAVLVANKQLQVD